MSSQANFTIVQEFVQAIEVRDRSVIERSLAANVRQVFPMGSGGWEGLGAIFEGKAEVLEYTFGLFESFNSLAWVHKDWTLSADGSRVFLQAKSDCIVAHTKAPYRNTYVMRFDVSDGQITQILEYAISELYVATRIPLSDALKRAVARAQRLPEDADVR